MEIPSDETRPPVGRRQQNKEKRRGAIIQLAMRSFLEHGFEGTSMSAIATAMGGSKGTLWSYFGSKEELLAAVIETVSSKFQAFMASVLDPKRNVREVLTNFCETYIARISMPDAIAIQRLVLSQAGRLPEVGRIFYDRAPAVNHAALTKYFAALMTAGVIREDDPEDAARMLLDMCTGGYHDLVLWGVGTVDATVERREAARVVRQFLRCYSIAPAADERLKRKRRS
ncbi:TetR/AcrR family transcriptional regulator [Fimbriiglobus ruber]|uniref:Transcriptional regulator, TetR family n=1 Tax=Fimbriiglobus ruber TaxID=1908690 RepID=A0A225EAP9_9BACT|nr:TetR/AcrR family transcriptional regulator [Fimbriiglobus ruber]OWK46459.1 Transcriptional regulator, TetR family [Fimbriiglobus ruber]